MFARSSKGWVRGEEEKHRGYAIRYGDDGLPERCSPREWRRGVKIRRPEWPKPGTEEFFRCYSEPVEAILQATRRLARQITRLHTTEGIQPVGSPFLDPERGTFVEDVNWIQHRTGHDDELAIGVSLTTEPFDNGRLRQQIWCHSLFGAIVMMTFNDMTRRAGTHIVRCEWCGGLSRAANPRAKYCNDSHRALAEKARKKARAGSRR